MHFIYIDDSGEGSCSVFSALAIPVETWCDSFEAIKSWRRYLKSTYSIYIRKELHATKFLSGRGNVGAEIVTKYHRSLVFRSAFKLLADMPHIKIFNVCFSHGRQNIAFERLLNRINRTMLSWNSHAFLICDDGKEAIYTKMARRMSIHNPIPSQYGTWQDTGRATRNIPLNRIIEDPVFKDSERSYFIQLADFVAYGLLRREIRISSKDKYGVHKCFEIIENNCVKEASPRDPLGIVRY